MAKEMSSEEFFDATENDPDIKHEFYMIGEPFSILQEVLILIQMQKNWEKVLALFFIYYGEYRRNANDSVFWLNVKALQKITGWAKNTVYKYRKILVKLGFVKLKKVFIKNKKFPITLTIFTMTPKTKIPVSQKLRYVSQKLRRYYNNNTDVLLYKDKYKYLSNTVQDFPNSKNVVKNGIRRNNFPSKKQTDQKKKKQLSRTDINHPKNIEYLRLAKKFHKILKNNKKLNPKTNLKTTTNNFRLCIESDLKDRYDKKQAIQIIDDILKFLKSNITDKYCPQVYSGDSFRRKFEKLIAALERQNDSDNDKKENLEKEGIYLF